MIAEVLKYVSQEYGTNKASLLGVSRFYEDSNPRQFCWWLLSKRMGVKHKEIAIYFKRDRATIASGIATYHRKYMKLLETPPDGYQIFADSIIEKHGIKKKLLAARWQDLETEIDCIIVAWKGRLKRKYLKDPEQTMNRLFKDAAE